MPRIPEMFKMNSEDNAEAEEESSVDGEAASRDDQGPRDEFLADVRSPQFQGPTKSEWRCFRCDGDQWVQNVYGTWPCLGCEGTESYSCLRPHRHETDEGVWMFMPRRPDGPDRRRPQGPGPEATTAKATGCARQWTS